MIAGLTTTIRSLPRTPTLSLLESCKNMRELKQIHAQIIRGGLSPHGNFVSSKVISFCAVSPFGNLDYAKIVFKSIEAPSIFTWNSMIRGLASSKNPQEAIFLFCEMLQNGIKPNNFTFPFVIKACTQSSLIQSGEIIHTNILKSGFESDSYVKSSLIHMYADGKDLDSAHHLFDESSERCVVSWNSMIDGYVKSGDIEAARSIFDRMEDKDVVSWNTMIAGYGNLGDIGGARELFDKMPERSMVSWNSMLTGYAKCGDVEAARKVFDGMPKRDVVSWNAMLACYAQGGQSNEALALFEKMCDANVRPTEATIVSMLSACAHLGALDQGIRLNSYIDEQKLELTAVLGTALVDMYAKCGSIAHANRVFCAIEYKDVLAWNTIIAGMAMHGHAIKCHQIFKEMLESGLKPDDITFVAMLSAYSHAGMVDEGHQMLASMSDTHGISPKVEHYGCVIDLLARAGLLEEAIEIIGNMPMEPNASAWGALLGGCRIHGNIDVGERVGKMLINLQPHHSGRYVLLSNIYAAANRWDDARRVRNLMRAKGVVKSPGFSMIEMAGIVHQFVAGDRSHPETTKIYEKLVEISKQLKISAGYSPDTKQVLFDIEEEEKEHSLSVHSEKLAIAFGFLHTSPKSTIRVVKNLRVCKDCHNFTKLISMAYCREIVVRDRNRFHHFKQGTCSCMDYW